jgi:hypothetical protein
MVKLGDRVRLSAPRLKHGSQHRVCSTSALVSLSNTRRCDEDLLPGAGSRCSSCASMAGLTPPRRSGPLASRDCAKRQARTSASSPLPPSLLPPHTLPSQCSPLQHAHDASQSKFIAMTAPPRSTPHSSALPASQTAPVNEFKCLFTHDLRRKQKRWQDGYLKFHTFNSRIMVTDQARNHIGETYWKESHELQEGEELSLDRGVMVEVAEPVGTTQTDLTPLFGKKTREQPKEPPTRPTPSATVRPFQRPSSVAPTTAQRTGTQLRHKSLNTLLGTPKGPVGKAVPRKSPYDERKRQEKEDSEVENRAAKRQKTAQRPGGWRASSPAQEESPTGKPLPLWARTADAKNARVKASTPQPLNIITISSESDHVPVSTSDVALPSTPEGFKKPRPRAPVISAPAIKPNPPPKPPPVQTPKISPVQTPTIPRGKVPVPSVKAAETPKRPAPPSSPPVSASNRLTNVDFAVQPMSKPRKEPSPPPSPVRHPKAKSLRLSTGVRRGTLMCQSLPQRASRGDSENRNAAPKSQVATASRRLSKGLSPPVRKASAKTAGSLALDLSEVSPPARGKRKSPDTAAGAIAKKARIAAPPKDPFDDPEIMHSLMDQQLLISSSPTGSKAHSSPWALTPVHKSPPAKAAASKERSVIERPMQSAAKISLNGANEAPTPVTKERKKRVPPKKKVVEKPQLTRRPSPPPAPVLKPPAPTPREVSPAHSATSGSISRTSSTSPTKVFSTGGFPTKPKRNRKPNPKAASPDAPVPTSHSGDLTLPPHPLVASKKGPLMSPSELASLLQKPKKRVKNDDRIEDDAATSINRSFRRVRSVNDAPIPSTAEDWEQRNLPRTSSNLAEAEPGEKSKVKTTGLADLIKRTDPRKEFQRAKSLSVETNFALADGEEGDVDVELPSPVLDTDVGPWSTEAFDLFDWRPPGKEGEA